jgi:amino acid adenylation domain-containing protein
MQARPAPDTSFGSLPALIAAQAQLTPGQPAIAFERRSLTYAELERRAAKLARRLKDLGARPDMPVALFMERSLDLVVGILGILKAGAAYMPIDPATPRERIAFMLSDSGARIALTQRRLAGALPAGATKSLCLDEMDWSGAAPPPGAPPPLPEHLAYVIYTSGSTGKPKGVCIEHRNIASYVRSVIERVGLQPGLRHAMVSTIAADLGNTVLFPALVTGGCLHLISQERAEDPALLAEYFAREKIDVLKIVPSHLAALMSVPQPERVLPRQLLVLGGEASKLDWVKQLRAMAPGCRVFNHYGPTETTVGVLMHDSGSDVATPSGTLPLGQPLPHARARLVDTEGQPVSDGEAGELLIGGEGVARGYLKRPELTAEKFISDPDGGRWYRSGDLVRRLPGGDYEFLGRVDDQLKLNGHRIEPGEIAAALRTLPGVREALVLGRPGSNGAVQLAAYLVAQPGADPELLTAAALRAALGQKVQRHMVPQAFVVLDALPLNANGKVDRNALPSPDAAPRPSARWPSSGPSSSKWPRSAPRTISSTWADARWWRSRRCRASATASRLTSPCASSSSARRSPRLPKRSTA